MFVRSNQMPVVVGPENKFFIIDHHHQCRAVQDANIRPQWKVCPPFQFLFSSYILI